MDIRQSRREFLSNESQRLVMKILITCPPMLKIINELQPTLSELKMEVTAPNVIQTLSERELMELVPLHDGWVIGDDQASRKVVTAGKNGRLMAAVKWGIGVDNIDFDAFKDLEIPVTNTPNMFGAEVADVAVGYVIALARSTFEIDRGVRAGEWPKPSGMSLAGKTVALVGYGDIGRNTARRLLAADMEIIAYDPFVAEDVKADGIQFAIWPDRLCEADFIVMNCALTESSRHMLNSATLALVKHGVRVVNVGRGPLIDERALIKSLREGGVHSAALDVFEEEPLPADSYLRTHRHCILGSHNSSNSFEAVMRTSQVALKNLAEHFQNSPIVHSDSRE
ncbi:phosphoglycerate dehydrogenase [Luminiphilus sp.]|nr:phosphoglycerate dehydrogenase [Luminiphilus sp.]MDA9711251.1 phosphoglycerate dehydrogenase [Luminiphilus sp.]